MKTGKKILIVVLSVLALGVVGGGASYATAIKINGSNKTNDTIKGWFSTSDKDGATIKVADTKAVKMVDVSKDKGESDSWIAQYKIEKLSLTKDQEVTFTYKGKTIVPGASGDGNNLVVDSATKKLKVATTTADATIYLKVYKDGYDVWCTGFKTAVENYTMKIGNNNPLNMKKGEATDSIMTAQYCIENIQVKSGDKLTFELNGERIYPGASGELNNAIYDYETKNISVISEGFCNFYLKTYSDGGYDVWVTGLKDLGVKITYGTASNHFTSLMEVIPADVGGSMAEQYKFHIDTLNVGDELTFKKNGRALYPVVHGMDWDSPLSYDETTKKIILNRSMTNCDVYFKVFTDGYTVSLVQTPVETNA